jgi:chorismate lyase/3-hydroxybenzoate synthase
MGIYRPFHAEFDMSRVSAKSRPLIAASDPSDHGAPKWLLDLLCRDGVGEITEVAAGVRIRESKSLALLTVRYDGAASLDPPAFEECTRETYASIARTLQNRGPCHPVRFWNYIPDIHRPSGQGLDRYMCFNAGRFAACSEWLGGPGAFDRLLATGSGVGHSGPDLVIHALASSTPGTAVENPRQTPAYRYSRRFGPRPPCFARATILRQPGQAPLVLVGGTASIRGEESVHVNDLREQTKETFENLASLVRSAAGHDRAGLAAFRELRVYHFLESDLGVISELVERAFPSLARVEYLRADLCRPELAVEIEGVAQLDEPS